MEKRTLSELEQRDNFTRRHIGIQGDDRQAMLNTLGVASIEELIEKTVPSSIRLDDALDMAGAETETQALSYLKALASQNKVNKSYIGMGYHNTLVPNVISIA